VGKGRTGARVEVGAAPRAALVQKCKPPYGLCKGAKVICNVSGGSPGLLVAGQCSFTLARRFHCPYTYRI
jgi:hypothetical protein